MTGYTKLFGSIVNSTVWREDDKTRIVWITMLAMADRFGVVESSLPGLADAARVTIAECTAALARLSAPDPYSRTREHNGRRIEATAGGWLILNHGKYREKMSLDHKRETARARQARWRERQRTLRQKINHAVAADPITKADAAAKRRMQ